MHISNVNIVNTTAILTHQITIEMITKFVPQITMELILESGYPFQ